MSAVYVGGARRTTSRTNDGAGELSFVWIAVPPRLAALVSGIGQARTSRTPPPPPFDVPADAASLYRHAGITPRE